MCIALSVHFQLLRAVKLKHLLHNTVILPACVMRHLARVPQSHCSASFTTLH